MQHFNVATYDQMLKVVENGKDLFSHQNNCTLAELEIQPNNTIILSVSIVCLSVTLSVTRCDAKSGEGDSLHLRYAVQIDLVRVNSTGGLCHLWRTVNFTCLQLPRLSLQCHLSCMRDN